MVGQTSVSEKGFGQTQTWVGRESGAIAKGNIPAADTGGSADFGVRRPGFMEALYIVATKKYFGQYTLPYHLHLHSRFNKLFTNFSTTFNLVLSYILFNSATTCVKF